MIFALLILLINTIITVKVYWITVTFYLMIFSFVFFVLYLWINCCVYKLLKKFISYTVTSKVYFIKLVNIITILHNASVIKQNSYTFYAVCGVFFTGVFLSIYLPAIFPIPEPFPYEVIMDLENRKALKIKNVFLFNYKEPQHKLPYKFLETICFIVEGFQDEEAFGYDKLRSAKNYVSTAQQHAQWLLNATEAKQNGIHVRRNTVGGLHHYLYHWKLTDGLGGYGHEGSACSYGTSFFETWNNNQSVLSETIKLIYHSPYEGNMNYAYSLPETDNPAVCRNTKLIVRAVKIFPGWLSPQERAEFYSLSHREILTGIRPSTRGISSKELMINIYGASFKG